MSVTNSSAMRPAPITVTVAGASAIASGWRVAVTVTTGLPSAPSCAAGPASCAQAGDPATAAQRLIPAVNCQRFMIAPFLIVRMILISLIVRQISCVNAVTIPREC